MFRRLTPWLSLILILILPATALLQEGVCPPLVQRALEEAGNQCGNLPRNAACYGFNQVSAEFSADVADSFFSRPSDTTELTMLKNITTAALDDVLGRWGVAVLNVQANVPNSIPGQGVRFILFGDVSLTNEVDPAAARQPVTPVEINIVTGANFRSGPTTRSNILGGILAGTSLFAEGISADAAWAYAHDKSLGWGWLAREVITTNGDLSTLPVITETSRAPMQAFQFRTGLGRISCNQAPSALMVQGPQDLKVTIEANGAEITFGSTILLRTLDNQMNITTVEGEAIVNDLLIPAGYEAEATLNEDGEAGDFGGMARVTEEELEAFGWLEEIPVEVLEYQVEVPTFDEVTEDTLIFTEGTEDVGDDNGDEDEDLDEFDPANPDELPPDESIDGDGGE